MTSLEHVSVGHALNRTSSWTGDGDGGVVEVEVRGEMEIEVEEVSVGLAVTTTEEEEEQVGIIAVVGDDQGRQRVEQRQNENENEDANGSEDDGNGNDKGEGGDHHDSDHVVGFPRRLSVGMASLRQGSDSRTRSAGSHSNSNSNSNSRSQSRSRSSVREGLEMGESSAATSWTQADVDAEGVGSGERPSGEAYCRSSVDGPKLKEDVVDVGVGEQVTPRRGGTEVVSLSYLRTNASTGTDVRSGGEDGDGGGGGGVSRKEEVLVVQEEDIGEGWHPLQDNNKARSQDHGEGEGEGGSGEVEVEVGSVHALESIHGGRQSLETNEKERWRTFGSSGRNARHLRLEFKRPSPQPWDEIDPPTDNNEAYTSDYYSTLNSKRFGTLQKNCRRPLIPRSSYYFGPPPPDSAYGTSPVGQIGVHHPREIVRIERDYAGGELIQFSPVFPLELEGRITPTQFHQTINDINEILISAHSIQHAFVDNLLAVVTLQLSTLITTSHYAKEMQRLKQKVEEMNTHLYNPVGLHILWPQKVAFLFLEIEYY